MATALAKAPAPAAAPKAPVSAAEMGSRQREISVSEFFTKNRHLLGFDNPRKALLTCVKEAVDNALDAAEEAGVSPRISVSVTDGSIVVTDNGPGIPTKTVKALLDFSVRVSSTILAMPYVLDGTVGRVEIAARGINHTIEFKVDSIRQVPVISHVPSASPVKNGTRVTVHWPKLACSILAKAEDRFLQIAGDYTWLNPHLDLAVDWNGKRRLRSGASVTAWEKWLPSYPTSPHWYDQQRLERLIAAYVSHDSTCSRTVREFISEFRGLSATAKQAAVLDKLGLARAPLESLCANGKFNKRKIAALLAAMQATSKPVKAKLLGLIGRDHLAKRMAAAGVEMESFDYSRTFDTTEDGVPCVVEFAFGWCPEADGRRLITGVNWSPGITNPFRQLGSYGLSLDTILSQQRADRDEPVILLLHTACRRVEYTDRGKSAIAIAGEDESEDVEEDFEEAAE
jgi:DNA topoisomerase VI subunit B